MLREMVHILKQIINFIPERPYTESRSLYQ